MTRAKLGMNWAQIVKLKSEVKSKTQRTWADPLVFGTKSAFQERGTNEKGQNALLVPKTVLCSIDPPLPLNHPSLPLLLIS